ncbi:hypothetical protein [Erythrobacter mangrovi]|uniref:Uncharacterized protein n=1 Tax=Erythrobacter mangrovi TaxID=2739433 RepID=A0A7D4B8A8_9SPHN|nr:hypothetical protein [Erythrobacter mangrovi]QKG71663.1 hypothetical protein HQR01_09965 [Erythrobacter mangrovi]
MTVGLAIVGALLLLVLVFVVSMKLTDRKSNEDLKKRTPDASEINADSGYATPVGDE